MSEWKYANGALQNLEAPLPSSQLHPSYCTCDVQAVRLVLVGYIFLAAAIASALVSLERWQAANRDVLERW